VHSLVPNLLLIQDKDVLQGIAHACLDEKDSLEVLTFFPETSSKALHTFLLLEVDGVFNFRVIRGPLFDIVSGLLMTSVSRNYGICLFLLGNI